MDVRIHDHEALAAVSPTALAAYARAAGWVRTEAYGSHADIYQAEGQPEIILPRTQRVGDYALVVSRLVGIFAAAAETDELALYRDLMTADRDVVRIAAATGDESVSVDDGVALMAGARNLLLAAASSLRGARPLYRKGADRDAAKQLQRMRFGLPERGSFVVTVQTSPIPRPIEALFDDKNGDNDVAERRTTRRLAEALYATKRATEGMVFQNDREFWTAAVSAGSSANLCEALVAMIEPFPALDVSFSWAKTREPPPCREAIHFANDDVPILRQAAQSFRREEPRLDTRLYGLVRRLKRDGGTDGEVSISASIDDSKASVTTVLTQRDYAQAAEAHLNQAIVVLEGDLERTGQRWRLLNPRIVEVIDR